MSGRRVLIVGLGIAGMSAAIRLRRAGWEPVIIERAPERRVGGYFIGLFGTGRKAAEQLGIAGSLHTRNPEQMLTWETDRVGNRFKGVGYLEQPGDPSNVVRGDIEQALFDHLGDIEVRYGVVPESMTNLPDRTVQVVLVRTGGAGIGGAGIGGDVSPAARSTERFDLVIGADGVRSWTRRNVVDPEGGDHLHPLGSMMMCAFEMTEQVPGYRDDEGVNLTENGRSVWIFPFGDRPPTVLMSYRTDDPDAQFLDPPAQTLRRVFTDGTQKLGPVLEHVLSQLDSATNVLFDSANQVKVDTWRNRRVLLLGDAAWCVTLYVGMGASSSMGAAALLGDLLEAHPDDVDTALSTWEQKVRPYVEQLQAAAPLYGQFINPSNRIVLTLRNALMRRSGRKVKSAPKLNADGTYKNKGTQLRNVDMARL